MSELRIITAKEAQESPKLEDVWYKIHELYLENPQHAVRSQELIKTLHHKLAIDLYTHLSKEALSRGINVVEEAPIYGAYKKKDVDIAVIDPYNGPLITVGVRSQMSSIGNNVLTYYQDIIGECISLQERFPMATMGYVYLHPLTFIKNSKRVRTNVERYAQIYSTIAERDDRLYKQQLGSYDHFAYAVVDFTSEDFDLRDDLIKEAVPDIDLSIMTFIDRMVNTFVMRNIWLGDLFE